MCRSEEKRSPNEIELSPNNLPKFTRSTYTIELQFTVSALRDAAQLLLVDVGQTVAWRLNAGFGREGEENRSEF